MNTKLSKWRELATDTAKELIVAKTYVKLQSDLGEAAWKAMDAQTAKVAEFKKQLARTNAELSQISAKDGELNDEIGCVYALHAACSASLDDHKLLVG